MPLTHRSRRLRPFRLIASVLTILPLLAFGPPPPAKKPVSLPSTAAVSGSSGLYVAVGYGGRRRSSRDGQHWDNDTEWAADGGDDDNCLFSIVFAQNKYVAVGGGASLGHVLVTMDGKTWRETHRANTRIVPIVYGNHRFVVGRGLDFEFSPDGETWTTGGHLPYDRGLYFRRAVFGNGVFVFCGDCDLAPNTPRGGWRATSADGITIASFVTDLPNTRSIAFGAGRFVLIGEHGLRETSTDGKVWTKAFDPQEDFRWVFWTGRQFVLGGNATYVSPDGLHWTKDSAANVPCEPQCVGPDGLIGVSWKTNLWRSADGLQWQKSVDDGTNAYTAVAYGTPKPAPR